MNKCNPAGRMSLCAQILIGGLAGEMVLSVDSAG